MFLKQNNSTYILVGPFVTSANVMTTAVTTAMILDISQNGLLSTGQAITTIAIVSSQNATFRVNLSSASVATLGRWELIARQTVGIKMNYILVGNVVSSNYYDQMFGTSAIGGAGSTVTIPDIWAYSTRTLTATPPSTWGPTDVWNFSTRTLTSGAAVAPDVWLNSTRALTTGSIVAPDVWNHSTRSLTTASVVWGESSRTLTSTPPSTWGASDVWGAAARTLTSAAVVWSDLLETTVTYKQGMRGLTAAVLGNSTGGGTTQVKFQNLGSTVDRLTYDVTTDGNRSGVAFSW